MAMASEAGGGTDMDMDTRMTALMEGICAQQPGFACTCTLAAIRNGICTRGGGGTCIVLLFLTSINLSTLNVPVMLHLLAFRSLEFAGLGWDS